MLNDKRKWELEDIFYHSDTDPENLDQEEQKYWDELTARHLYSLLKKTIQADSARE